MPQSVPPTVAAQMIMQPQPAVDNSHLDDVTATAEFDPPSVRPGEKAFYRVSVTAMGDTIVWPNAITAPLELEVGHLTRAQLTLPDGTPFHPLTESVYEVTPTAAGQFVISNISVVVRGRRVDIPAASLTVNDQAPPAQPRKLVLDVSETNLFFGQPFRVRVMLPAIQGQIEALRDVQLNGGEILPDQFKTRNLVETVNLGGQLLPASIHETVAAPLATGPLTLSAQAFTAGNQFVNVIIHSPVSIRGGPPKIELLVSDPLKITVHPLPPGELPGFTGSIGKFFCDPPQLATNRLRVGEPVQLKLTFHGEGELTHFVPPAAPHSRQWQIIADAPPATSFTLIPLTDEVTDTPAIPFCTFDPATAKYVDLTIPALPVTVSGEGLPLETRTDGFDKTSPRLKLSALATTPGKVASSLTPLQLHAWFVGVQLAPVLGFIALWRWDRHRRFLEAHPEIVRRRRARRELRRLRQLLEKAVIAGDSENFLRHAVTALRVACAPHYPAQPQALVCGDVLAQMNDADEAERQTVRELFAAADTQFAAVPATRADLLRLNSQLQTLLPKLEAKL